jgi:type II secretory pathway component HofQ
MSLLSTIAVGQTPAPAAAPQSSGTTIRLLVILSKYEGDKKISSVPYTLSLVPGKPGSIRAGSEIPVPTTSITGGDKPNTTTSYTLQQVGSQIDATVNPTTDGKYSLQLSVTDRDRTSANNPAVPNVPTFKNMVSSSSAILSNGETIQFTSSTERTSNESLKIDVTLTVGNK